MLSTKLDCGLVQRNGFIAHLTTQIGPFDHRFNRVKEENILLALNRKEMRATPNCDDSRKCISNTNGDKDKDDDVDDLVEILL